MAVERVLSGEFNGESGTYRLWTFLDTRPSGEFIVGIEVDNTQRTIDTRYNVNVQGQANQSGVVPAGQHVKVPETGEWKGLRIDGGRVYSVGIG